MRPTKKVDKEREEFIAARYKYFRFIQKKHNKETEIAEEARKMRKQQPTKGTKIGRITVYRKLPAPIPANRKTMDIMEKLINATWYFENRRGFFETLLDIPKKQCSLLLEAVYMGHGVTVGYHRPTDSLFWRTARECWRLIVINEEMDA